MLRSKFALLLVVFVALSLHATLALGAATQEEPTTSAGEVAVHEKADQISPPLRFSDHQLDGRFLDRGFVPDRLCTASHAEHEAGPVRRSKLC
jgi:hypothetical protein